MAATHQSASKAASQPASQPSMHHPIGVQPEGNLMMTGGTNCRNPGIGSFQVLSDALLLEVLGLVTAHDLARLSCVSRAFYCFCDHEDLWKACVIETFQGGFVWRGTWRASYVASREEHARPMHQATQPEQAPERPRKRARKAATPPACAPRVRVRDFYSDLLYQPWHCATVELPEEWLEVDNIDRRTGLSHEEFREQYEVPNRPVVLTDSAAAWPALHRWTVKYLRKAYGKRPVIAGDFQIPFSTYLSYAQNTHDEMPLYLFDKAFACAASSLAADFSVPEVFKEDLFACLGDARPDYRWLIAGPPRSGSSFHIDPNSTSAWNGVVTGAKKWILYPPGVVPPGVYPSADGADVAAPVSLLEWFINFYSCTQEGKVRPVECVVKPGEVMFVPRGWWHACINLSWTVAVTQNFVSSVNLRHVLDFLRAGRSDLVSGCALSDRGDLHDRFVAALKQEHPELLSQVESDRNAARQKAEEVKKLTSLFKAEGPTADRLGTVKGQGQMLQPTPGPESNGGTGKSSSGFAFCFNVS